MARRLKPVTEVAADTHLHSDVDVTVARLDAFAIARVEVQLRVLARLRVNAHSQEGGQLLALQSLGVAIIAIFFAMIPGIVPRVPYPATIGSLWWLPPIVAFVGNFIAPAVVLLVLAPLVFDLARTGKKQERGVVWLAAYEDELARRRGQSGRRARSWRREHPL